MTRLTILALSLSSLLFATTGCKTKEKFPTIALHLASPIDVGVSADNSHFYVLNADFDRTYNVGSILVLDQDGNKVKSIEVPRMGRSLTVAGDDLIVTFDYPDDKESAHTLLFDISDPANPVQKVDFTIDCSPVNAVAVKGYPYFFVSCLSGALYAGTFGTPRETSQIKLVRRYGVSRRALYLDTKRNLLLGFTTDTSKQLTSDKELRDDASFDGNAIEIKDGDAAIPDDIPDDMQNSRRVLSSKGQRQLYQFFVYDIQAEKAAAPVCAVTPDESCAFPERDNNDPIVIAELRWIYFKLYNFDGAPDPSEHFFDNSFKYYRTNFYDAKADPTDPDVFYLSQRGNPTKSPLANQIVRVTFNGDLRVKPDGKQPFTAEVLSFERVYGFKGAEATKQVFPGDFEIQEIAGQKTLLVNNFRDLINWVRTDTYFSLGAQVLDDTSWFAETTTNDSAFTSWYQVALTPSGRAMSCSFYGNAVMLLDVKPGVGITELKRIE